jgi:hypothetical protein
VGLGAQFAALGRCYLQHSQPFKNGILPE